jgi:thiamine kinase-like enzyme
VFSYADVMLKLFNLKVPQKIGSLGPGSSLSTPGVLPKFGLQHSVSADKVFCDIKEFFDFLSSVKRHSKFIGEDSMSRERAATVLNALEAYVYSLFIPTPLLRIVLVHDDPNYANILIDESSKMCGIVD